MENTPIFSKEALSRFPKSLVKYIKRKKSVQIKRFERILLELLARFELATSSLPRMRSTY